MSINGTFTTSVNYVVQSKPVYSNNFFTAENGKNKPIVRKNRWKLTQNVIYLQIKEIKLVRKNDKLEKPDVRINRFGRTLLSG